MSHGPFPVGPHDAKLEDVASPADKLPSTRPVSSVPEIRRTGFGFYPHTYEGYHRRPVRHHAPLPTIAASSGAVAPPPLAASIAPAPMPMVAAPPVRPMPRRAPSPVNNYPQLLTFGFAQFKPPGYENYPVEQMYKWAKGLYASGIKTQNDGFILSAKSFLEDAERKSRAENNIYLAEILALKLQCEVFLQSRR